MHKEWQVACLLCSNMTTMCLEYTDYSILRLKKHLLKRELRGQNQFSVIGRYFSQGLVFHSSIQNCKIDKDRLDEIVDLMLETVCTARKTIRIAGDDYPAELVKSKFLKLNSSHIEFVLDCMRENTTKVRNIKQYLKAVLFNAPSTIDSYYTALVNHDLYGGE